MNLDSDTIVSYPDQSVWSNYYEKFRGQLMHLLKRHSQSLADREDAVEEAFHKLMHKKGLDSYGDRIPETESGWFWALYWQARAYLSHLKSRGELHAKYVSRTMEELEDVFASGHQGEAMDAEIRVRALSRALETLKSEQDISPRDLEIYVSRKLNGLPSKVIAPKYKITANNVDVIVCRVGRLVRKHGARHFGDALSHEGRVRAA